MNKSSYIALALVLVALIFVPSGIRAQVITGAPNPVPHACIVLSDTLTEGVNDAKSKGQVTKLQRFLATHGELSQSDVSGYFGPKTKSALKKFQAKNKITEDGFAGQKTRKVMSKDCEPAVPVGAPVQLIDPKVGLYNPPETERGTVAAFFSSIYRNILAAVGATGGQSVTGFVLVDADTNQDIGPLTNGSVIDLSKLITKNVNIRAVTTPSPVDEKIRFAYAGKSNYVTDNTVPYTLGGDNGGADYSPMSLAVGSQTLTATPFKKNKSSGSALKISFNVVNSAPASDTTAPTVAILSPAGGTTVTGSLTLTASASDAVGVSKVEYFIDGAFIGVSQTAPYSVTASLSGISAGSHTITAKAYDAAGNVGTSAGLSIVVNTTAPAVSLLANPSSIPYNSSATLSWTSTNATGCTASGAWTGNKAASGSESTGNLLSAKTYTLACSNSAGSTVRNVTVSVVSAPDSTLPTVSISSPANNSSVSGTVSITASAQDNIGVSAVELYKDGTLLSTDTTSPYAFTWQTPAAISTVQPFSFIAHARDAAGNRGISSSIVLNVPALQTPVPVVTFAAGQTSIVSGGQTALTWSSTGANSCTASGSWSGSKGTVGNQIIIPTQTGTYTLTCTGIGGSTSKSVTITVTAPVDTIAPSVSITSPTNGQVVSGTIPVTVSASDNVGVSSVAIKLDGAAFGSPVTGASATFNLNTAAFSNSSHTITATAVDAAGNTGTSATVSITVNNGVSSPITVQVMNMISFNELVVNGSEGNDNITLSQSGSNITVTGNGVSQTFTGPFGDISVKGNGGDDIISIGSTVTTRSRVYGGNGNNAITAAGSSKVIAVTISGGVDTITGNGNTSYWVGNEDVVRATSAETSTGKVHKVGSFANYASLALNGPNIPDPTDTSWNTQRTVRSFWGKNPDMTDINQGVIADCYYLAGLASVAYMLPEKLQETGVDLGDGTYAIQYIRNGVTSFVRVDGDLDFQNARPGANGSIWGMVHEKAYAYYRRGLNTYASLNTGNALSWRDYGIVSSGFTYSPTSALTGIVANHISSKRALAATSLGTVPAGIPIIGFHLYSVIGTKSDGSIVVRNPWGFDGIGSDENPSDGIVTITPAQYQAATYMSGNFYGQ